MKNLFTSEKPFEDSLENNANSSIMKIAALSTLVALLVTAIFPFGSLSFSLGTGPQLIATAVAGPASYYLWKEKRGATRFFMMHFMSTIVLGRLFELVGVVIIISAVGF